MEKPHFEAIAERVAFNALDWVPTGNRYYTLKASTDAYGIGRESVVTISSIYEETACLARAELSTALSLAYREPTVVDLDDFVTRVIARAAAIAQQCIDENSREASLKHSELLKRLA